MSVNDSLRALKVHCLTHGIRLTDAAAAVLTIGGELPLTVHEYATTGGVTLTFGDVYVNAPFDDWYCGRSEAVLDAGEAGELWVEFAGEMLACSALRVPGYLGATNHRGEPVTRTTMSHGDRIRVSPISGCTLDCSFCDLPALRYTRYSAAEMLASIEVAKSDTNLPPSHLLISGGSPGRAHFDWFDDTLVEVISRCGLPTDVMMSPREGSLDYLRRYADAGVQGFSFNLEVFGEARALEIMPRKHLRSTPEMARTVTAAVDRISGDGRVRSIVIIGLEDVRATLEAIDFVAGLGADPVLSPFRPAQKTKLERSEPPTVDYLEEVYAGALEIARRQGVRLGPRCIPCQHNTLTFPDNSDDYWYSSHRAYARADPA